MPETAEMTEQEVGTEGDIEQHWSSGYSEHEVLGGKDSQSILGRYKTTEDALVGLVEARKTISDPKRVLGDFDKLDIAKLDDKQKEAFLTKASELQGVPKTLEGYQDLDFKVGLAEDAPVDENLKLKYLQHAVENKFTKAQAQKDIALWNAMQTELRAEHDKKMRTAAEETVNHLRSSDVWGAENFPKYIETVRRFLRSFTSSEEEWAEFDKHVYSTGITNNAILLKALLPAAQMMIGDANDVSGGSRKLGGGKKSTKSDWEQNFPNSGKGPND